MDNKIFNYQLDDDFGFSQAIIKGNQKYYVEGYCSTVDKDKAGEVLDHSAQEDIYNQIQSENITLDLEHQLWYSDDGKLLPRPRNDKIPVAKVVEAKLTSRGVWIKAELNQNLDKFKELWGSIKDGFLKAFSVAFYPIQKAGSVIKHLNLVNITLTGSPVNSSATFAVAMKSASAWLDSQEAEVKATAPKSPSLDMPGVEAPKEVAPKHPKMTEVKSEDTPMKCTKCDKEFADKEALAEHLESVHGKEEKGDSETKACHGGLASVKAEEIKMVEEVKTPVAEVKAEPVVDIQAEVKAMKDAYAAELKALQSEVASLKAELAKPVMKATVEEKMPEIKPQYKIVSPLGLLR